MGWSDLENENRLRYEGQRNGWKTGPISQSQLLSLPADEFEFRRLVDPQNFQLALEGRDKQSLMEAWAKKLVPTKIYAEVTRGGVTMHSQCHTHPDMEGFIVRIANGDYYRAEALAGVRFVDADKVPQESAPQSFQAAQAAAKERAHANLANAQEIKRGQQTGITTTDTKLGRMMDAAKQQKVAQL